MSWMSAEAQRIAGMDLLQSITQADLVPELEAPAGRGWSSVDGAIVLTSWYMSYFGERDRFAETIDYEVAVNGRAIPDLDLTEVGDARVARLMRRGVAFAWAAIYEAHRQLPNSKIASYVSAAPTLMDPDDFTGNVTFCSVRRGDPAYIDPRRLTDEIVVAVFSEDCRTPLPACPR